LKQGTGAQRVAGKVVVDPSDASARNGKAGCGNFQVSVGPHRHEAPARLTRRTAIADQVQERETRSNDGDAQQHHRGEGDEGDARGHRMPSHADPGACRSGLLGVMGVCNRPETVLVSALFNRAIPAV
jgi:hypothetical protein